MTVDCQIKSVILIGHERVSEDNTTYKLYNGRNWKLGYFGFLFFFFHIKHLILKIGFSLLAEGTIFSVQKKKKKKKKSLVLKLRKQVWRGKIPA